MYRQGDILLVPASDVTQSAGTYQRIPAKRAVVGYGEATGHHHVVENVEWVVAPEVTNADLHEFAQGRKTFPVFVVAPSDTKLTHQEHGTLDIPAGTYRVIRQREYSPDAIRSVID